MRSCCRSPRPPGRITRRLLAGAIALTLATPALSPTARATHTGDGSLSRVTARGRLRVISGLSMAVPGPDGRLSDRFNAAVANLIAAELGTIAEIVPEPEAGRPIPRLIAEDIDLLLAAPVTRPVSTRLLLSRPYAMVDIVVIGPRTPRLRGTGSLAGRRIGVLMSYMNAYGATLPLPSDATIVAFESQGAADEALRGGRIDAALMPSLQARALAARPGGAVPLAIHYAAASLAYAAGVRFGAHDLLHAVNSCLAEALLHGDLPDLFRRETGLTLPPLPPL